MARPAYLYIDSDAFKHNLRVLRAQAPNSRVLAIVKANAYGHGIAALATALEDADGAGVCCVEEALELYELGYAKPIVVLQGYYDLEEIEIIQRYQFISIIRDIEQIAQLKKARIEKPLKHWIKVNTGMNRLGFSIKQFQNVYQALQEATLTTPTIVMTHFATADEDDHPLVHQQIEQFQTVVATCKLPVSLANSAAIFNYPQSHGAWIRPGLASYGISPLPKQTGLELGLRPVMSLCSRIISIQDCKAGESIGYGATYVCPQPMRIGVVAMGYADGYPQQAEPGTPVLVNNKATFLLGRVSMDMLVVDLTQQVDAKVGDPVTLWGKNLPVEMIAKSAKTSAYELVCGIHNRVKRLPLNSHEVLCPPDV